MIPATQSYANYGDNDEPTNSPSSTSQANEREFEPEKFCKCGRQKDPKRDQWKNGKWKKLCSRCQPANKKAVSVLQQSSLSILWLTRSQAQTKNPENGLTRWLSSNVNTHAPQAVGAAIPKADLSLTHNAEEVPPPSETLEQQSLLELIEGKPTVKCIREALCHYQAEGKELSWFQDILPELRPGSKDTAEWVETARNILWTAEIQAEHGQLCEREAVLSQTLPRIPLDEYGLRRYWPTVITALKPMTLEMAQAVDEVSIALGREDCILLTSDRSWKETPTGHDPPKHTFLVIRQALQDKILSPLIEAITAGIQQLPAEDVTAQDDRTTDEDAGSHQADSHQQIYRLRKLLQKLRDVVIAEKNEDRDSNTKELGDGMGAHETVEPTDQNGDIYRTARKRTGSSYQGSGTAKRQRNDA